MKSENTILSQVVIDKGLPFQPSLRGEPSMGFKEAIRELNEGAGEKFKNAADFRASWENDE